MAAVVIGLGHRIFGIPKIYGLFTNTRTSSLLIGPFINSNHSAEFLELATFVGIACARQAATPLARIGWLAAAVTCAAGAMATMSRASVFGLGVGAAVMVVGTVLGRRPSTSEPVRRERRLGLLVAALGLSAVVAGRIERRHIQIDKGRIQAIASDGTANPAAIAPTKAGSRRKKPGRWRRPLLAPIPAKK